nr:hypothetical protein [Verrucomicrobiota bacterium]
MRSQAALNPAVRLLAISIAAALAGFALAKLGGSPVATKRDPAPDSAVVAAPPAPELGVTATPPPASPGPGADKPPGERLSAVLHGKNPLESAARALVVIDALTADDFRQMAASSHNLPGVHGFDQEFSDAFRDALVERWLVVDPSGALAAIRHVEGELKKPLQASSGEWFAALARVRPELLLDALPPMASSARFD